MSYIRYPATGSGSVPTYANAASLPASADDGALAVTLDTDSLYIYDEDTLSWELLATGGSSVLAVGTYDSLAAVADGAQISANAIFFQSATATRPGMVSTGAQTFAGNKTFSGSVLTTTLDKAAAGTLLIGNTNATTITIGNASATVNILGTTLYENVTNLQVADKLFTVNYGGAGGTAVGAGMEIEEGGSITSYIKTSGDRNSFLMLAPNTVGVITFTPGASGFTIDQASHNPLTLGAVGSSPNANGASLSTQVLTLEPASASFPGVVSTASQAFAGAKTFGDGVLAATFISTAANVATAGTIRLANTESIRWRNNANSDNLSLSVDASDILQYGGAFNASGTVTGSNLSGSNTGDVTLAAVGSSPNANGASLSGQQLNLQPADATNPGVITTGSQTIAGNKTLNGTMTVTGQADAVQLTVIGNGTQTNNILHVRTSGGTSRLTIANDGTTTVNGSLSSTNMTANPTASTIMLRDASVNTAANNFVPELASTATAAGSTTLTVSSEMVQVFTGVTTQTVNLPNATTLLTGHTFKVINDSTGALTVNNNGGSLVATVAAGYRVEFVCTANGSSDGSWATNIVPSLPVPIASGGTGQTAKTAAFDALSPATTKGDIIVYDGSDNIRLAVGTNGYVPVANSSATSGIEWKDIGASDQSGSSGAVAWPVAADTFFDFTSLSLAAGTWAISGMLVTDYSGGAGSSGFVTLGINTNSGNNGSGLNVGQNQYTVTPNLSAGTFTAYSISNYIVTPVATTTYYLKGYADTSAANLRHRGYRMSAVRIK